MHMIGTAATRDSDDHYYWGPGPLLNAASYRSWVLL